MLSANPRLPNSKAMSSAPDDFLLVKRTDRRVTEWHSTESESENPLCIPKFVYDSFVQLVFSKRNGEVKIYPKNCSITTQRDYQVHFVMQLQYFFLCRQKQQKSIKTITLIKLT